MNPKRSVSLFFSLMVLLIGLVPATGSAAQQRSPSDAELLSRFTPAQIQAYRETIRETFNFGHEVAQVTRSIDGQKLIDQRMQILDKATDADMARLMSYGADFVKLRDSMIALRQALNWPVEQRNGHKVVALSAGFPDADYDFCGSTHGSAPALLAAQVTLDIAKGIWSVADRGCEETVVALGEGGNVALVCIVTDTVLFVAEAAFNGVQFCENDIDSAEINGSYRRLDHIHTDLENDTSDIENNDNVNTVSIINNDNSNKDTIVANDNNNRALIITNDNANRTQIITNDNNNRDLIISNELRLSIELSLSAQGSPLALFELPSPSGYLGLVGSIVRQSIDAEKANNQNVFQAERFYAQAVVQVGQGAFKDAFKSYQQAYREATK